MRTPEPLWKRAIGVLAIYAIALHVVLTGLVPAAYAAPTVDPLSVICHSVAPGAADRDHDKNLPAPGEGCCDHCDLCNVLAPPPTPETPLAGTLVPARVLDILIPMSTSVRTSIASNSKRARGPPQAA